MSVRRLLSLALILTICVASGGPCTAAEPTRKPLYSASAYRDGRADAERDIRRGVLAVEEWGMVADFDAYRAYRRILRERYGVTVRRVAGCEVDDTILGHGNGYNDVSEAEIERRFGRNLLDRAYAQAEKQARTTR